ncbi:MAG: hypothetical protein ACD_79C00387G0002 [uncultured bacterium]|nr:MAG: hypothetical protein ACD_79C00387G0002 [uncultured bacterium]
MNNNQIILNIKIQYKKIFYVFCWALLSVFNAFSIESISNYTFEKNVRGIVQCLSPASALSDIIIERNILEKLNNELIQSCYLKKMFWHDSEEFDWKENKNNFPEFDFYIKTLPQKINENPSIIGTEDVRFLSFVRAGPMFLVDSSLKNIITSSLLAKLNNNIIFINNLAETELGEKALERYTLLSIINMVNNRDYIKGRIFIDAGAGQGILSLVAIKLGAASSILIENGLSKNSPILLGKKISLIDLAFKNFKINQLNKFMMLEMDLQRIGQISSIIKNLYPGNSTKFVVSSNIGYWKNYNITNLTSLALADNLNELYLEGGVESLFLGGFDSEAGGFTKSWDFERVEENLLKKFGYDWEIFINKLTMSLLGIRFLRPLWNFPVKKIIKRELCELDILIANHLGYSLKNSIRRDFSISFRRSRFPSALFLTKNTNISIKHVPELSA